MKLFFDTSALVKYFHEEEGTASVTAMIESGGSEIWVSELCRLEFISALFRRARAGEINEAQLKDALSDFDETVTSFNCEPVSHATLVEAESLLRNYGRTIGLRTLDALQAASFSLLAESDWVFVSSDRNLCQIVKLMGFECVNPTNE